MRSWLETGRPAAVLALSARFPDDYCGPALNRLLALLRSGAEAEATDYLASIAPRHGRPSKLLAAATLRRPRVEHGRAEDAQLDAWYYREETRACGWRAPRSTGCAAWARLSG